MQKSVFFSVLVLLLLVDFTNYVFLVPILPDFLMKRGVSLTLIGIILSFYQIGNFFTSLYLGKNMIYFSKKKLIGIGQITLICSNVAFGFLDYSSSTTLIMIFCVILRTIQGSALALSTACIFSYIPVLYPDDLDKKYAIVEMTTGIGLAMGPIIAGFLYEYLHYTWSFGVMSLLYTAVTLIVFPIIMSYNINNTTEKSKKNSQLNSEENKIIETPPIQARILIKNRNLAVTILVFICSFMSYSIIQPGFSDHVHSYGGSEDDVGIIFAIGDITYALTGVFIMHLISKYKVNRKYLVTFGGFMSMIGLLIVGPEHYTFIPKNIVTVAVAMGIMGFSQMFYVPILIPEFIDILKEIDQNAKGSEEMAAALFNASIAITNFLGSFIGGFLTDYCGFDRGMAIYAMVLLCVLIVYVIFRKITPKNNNVNNVKEQPSINKGLMTIDDEIENKCLLGTAPGLIDEKPE